MCCSAEYLPGACDVECRIGSMWRCGGACDVCVDAVDGDMAWLAAVMGARHRG
jgi:hypothetical protein